MPEDRTMAYGGTMAPLVDRRSRHRRRVRRRPRHSRIPRRLSTSARAGRSGGSGPCPRPASRDPRRGRAAPSRVGGGATWLTGTYDPDTATLFWPTGNPYPDTDGSERGGDNLYTDCCGRARREDRKAEMAFPVHAARSTRLGCAVDRWCSSTRRSEGRERKLLVQANRNGFYYVLDRTRWDVSPRRAVRQEAHVGERNRCRRPAATAAEQCRARNGAR